MTLSPEQLAAVTRTGQDVCAVAGPGSGKTRVLVERYAWLVETGAAPGRILAITFTDKAAQEIKHRLALRFAGNAGLKQEIERAPVSTVHGFCAALLREHALWAALDPEFAILDEQDAQRERNGALDVVLDRIARERTAEFRALLAGWNTQNLHTPILPVYDTLRMSGGVGQIGALPVFDPAPLVRELGSTIQRWLAESPAPASDAQRRREDKLLAWLARGDVFAPFECDKRGLKAGHPVYDGLDEFKNALLPAARRAAAGALFGSERALLRDILLAFDVEFRARKRRSSKVDFQDLEEWALRLLETQPARAEQIRQRYDAILMDELQDTNPLQWALLERLRRPGRFFAVGDINQSIYGFRHAEPALFARYQEERREAGEAIDRLEDNYRSRAEILAAVDGICGHLSGIQPHPLRAGKPSGPPAGACIELLRVQAAGSEPAWIAQRISELAASGRRYGDIAVLARTTAVFDPLEEALTAAGIPYVLPRGRNFFEEQEVLDLIEWLRLLADPADEIARLGLLRSPFFGLSDEEILRMKVAAEEGPAEFVERLARLRRLSDELPVDLLLAREVDECGYAEGLPARGRANLDKFFTLLRRLQADAPGAVREWLDRMEEARESGREPNAPALEGEDAVQVLTIHKAKGLEFPVVFVVSMQRGAGGPAPALSWSRQSGLGAAWRLPGSTDTWPDPAHFQCGQSEKAREELEADRLLYVALTRAEEHLILSYEATDRPRGRWHEYAEAARSEEWRVVDLGEAAPFTAAAAGAGGAQAEELLPAPDDPHPVPRSLSVTSLVEFVQCPRRYWLRSTLGVEEGEAAPGAATGSEVHALLAGQAAENASEEAMRLVRAFRQSPIGRAAAAARRVSHEFDFLFEVETTPGTGVILKGQMDLWFDSATERVLVDYKTDSRPSMERVAAYEHQLRFYAKALEAMDGRAPAHTVLFFLRTREAWPVDLSAPAWENSLEQLRAWRRAHEGFEFPTREGAQCRYCPYVGGACPVVPAEQEPTGPPRLLD